MTEKYILSNGGVKDTVQGITFDSFSELLVVLNGQSRHLQKLSDENEQLKQENKKLADGLTTYFESKIKRE